MLCLSIVFEIGRYLQRAGVQRQGEFEQEHLLVEHHADTTRALLGGAHARPCLRPPQGSSGADIELEYTFRCSRAVRSGMLPSREAPRRFGSGN